LAPNIHVALDLPGFRREEDDSRGELLQAVLAARSTVKDVQAQFTDIGISLSPDRQTAEALLTLKAKIGTEPDWVVQELRFRFKSTNHDWLIAGLESVKMLR
jgi:predicted PhzF superfamily epimerase YddE/YHI9